MEADYRTIISSIYMLIIAISVTRKRKRKKNWKLTGDLFYYKKLIRLVERLSLLKKGLG